MFYVPSAATIGLLLDILLIWAAKTLGVPEKGCGGDRREELKGTKGINKKKWEVRDEDTKKSSPIELERVVSTSIVYCILTLRSQCQGCRLTTHDSARVSYVCVLIWCILFQSHKSVTCELP
jgi:hypothetical protein